jgi:hypothetical protein
MEWLPISYSESYRLDYDEIRGLEWLPISYSESYRLDYDEIRGLALHFWIQNEGDENDKIVLEKELAELKLALDLLQ